VPSLDNKQALVADLIGFYLILEGTFFYTNFAQLFSLRRQNKMKGLAKFIDLILRDESVHISLGTDIILTISQEHPEIFTEEFVNYIVQKFQIAVLLEDAYIQDSIQPNLFGLRREDFSQYVRYIAKRRLESIRIQAPVEWDVKNPFPWMSTEADLPTESNFFESRSIEYSTGQINMEDF
jgi:ribonucleoside-diphosphate reductase beta chain